MDPVSTVSVSLACQPALLSASYQPTPPPLPILAVPPPSLACPARTLAASVPVQRPVPPPLQPLHLSLQHRQQHPPLTQLLQPCLQPMSPRCLMLRQGPGQSKPLFPRLPMSYTSKTRILLHHSSSTLHRTLPHLSSCTRPGQPPAQTSAQPPAATLLSAFLLLLLPAPVPSSLHPLQVPSS